MEIEICSAASGNCFQSQDMDAKWSGLLEGHLCACSALLLLTP